MDCDCEVGKLLRHAITLEVINTQFRTKPSNVLERERAETRGEGNSLILSPFSCQHTENKETLKNIKLSLSKLKENISICPCQKLFKNLRVFEAK